MFEADALLTALKRAGLRVSKATVYRTIRLLQDAGIIQRVLFVNRNIAPDRAPAEMKTFGADLNYRTGFKR